MFKELFKLFSDVQHLASVLMEILTPVPDTILLIHLKNHRSQRLDSHLLIKTGALLKEQRNPLMDVAYFCIL